MATETQGELQGRITTVTHAAMKARDRQRVAVMRLIGSELKRVEVDERRALSDADVIAILQRMQKQRRESERQYREADRDDLAGQEAYELAVLAEFLPQPMDETALTALVDAAIAAVDATGMQAMGPVMARLKDEVAGRAEMADVSRLVRARLGS